MPEPPSPELKSFLDALEQFGSNPPRDLPDGAVDMAKELGRALRGYAPNEDASPGEREAMKYAPGSDEAVHYSKAAAGVDGPSPGQREMAKVAERAREVADALSQGSN